VAAARFPRQARLQQPREFDAVFERGKRYSESKLTALVGAVSDGAARLGLAVPKKVVRDAHARNRIKRHVRESFRRARASLPAADIVIVARAGSGLASADELRAALQRLWTRIETGCAPPSSS
jgi:ribonuclease P protein component